MLEDACLLEDECLAVRTPFHKQTVIIHNIAPKHNRRGENLVFSVADPDPSRGPV